VSNRSTKEQRHRLKDLANAAALTARAAGNADPETVSVSTPYGQATVHLDRQGADVDLPEGATVHVRFGG
jgi:predicted lipid-binding transport protein (Tim44 family)